MSLTCQIAKPGQYTSLSNTTDGWSRWASDRATFIQKQQKKDTVDNIDWLPVLISAVAICKGTSVFLQQAEDNDLDDFNNFSTDKDIDKDFDQAYVCKDSLGAIQGVALTKILTDEKLEVIRLMTHPNNIPSSLPKKTNGIKGVGSALISHLKQVCLDNCYHGIILEPTGTALAFYEKTGFTNIGNEDNPKMLLTIDQIRASNLRSA